MLRQSTKTDKELMQLHMERIGVDSKSFVLVDSFFPARSYHKHSFCTRQEQEYIIDKINDFDGISYILVDIRGNERVEEYLFLQYLHIYWDGSKQAKRFKRLHKIKSKFD